MRTIFQTAAVILVVLASTCLTVTPGPAPIPRYETVPRWIGSKETGTFFHWSLYADWKTVAYEPCSGAYDVQVLTRSNDGLVFRIVTCHGQARDLMTGALVANSGMTGRRYSVKLKGTAITEIRERS